jgi:dTMP kinase
MSPLSLRPRRGLFFSFEGIDGSGKSTQARLLANALSEAGLSVLSVREPGGTVLGEQIRTLLLNPEAAISPRAEALLFAAARAQLVEDVIEPALLAGQHVIADRFVDSTTAYQGAGRQLGNGLNALSHFATSGRMPDRTYIVSVTLEEAIRRRASRAADRMEQTDHAFQTRILQEYEAIAEREPMRVLAVDGSCLTELIHQRVLADASELIRNSQSTRNS